MFHVFTPFQRMEELRQLSELDIPQDKLNHCNEEINQLCKSLMSLEFQLVSQMEVIMYSTTWLCVCVCVAVYTFCAFYTFWYPNKVKNNW